MRFIYLCTLYITDTVLSLNRQVEHFCTLLILVNIHSLKGVAERPHAPPLATPLYNMYIYACILYFFYHPSFPFFSIFSVSCAENPRWWSQVSLSQPPLMLDTPLAVARFHPSPLKWNFGADNFRRNC